MVNNNTSSELQETKPHYNGAREAEDNDIMSSVPNNSYDSPRAQVKTNILTLLELSYKWQDYAPMGYVMYTSLQVRRV